ncbi:Polysaccharide deacetylase [Micromonospora phaseoli]|uniref:Polysaccharide deacetylase n=1 Tax=Micromonospora phaseoli TaxID=1144548 RepID=A0A1H6T0S6_9ACTN|nr:polysaccharide deacetylase family protein [Micromonospora phaseoli]PZW04184.1 polysaccharide deacetylase [Micromonospora phaseoli]GIJ79370.1 glycosyl transferase [Micromonospora phaseoli]SEI73671.1 Polysaccharide deacetylase [Micromonospora phaseoli]
MTDHRVINILFHGIGTPRREMEPGEERYWVSVDRFHELLDEVVAWPQARLSFDDGNASDLDVGLPALLDRQVSATFFIIAGRLGSSGSVDADGVRELRRHGMPVGSHGMWHRPWRRLTAEQATEEFHTARDRLAELTGAPVDQAACPLGRYDRAVLARLKAAGYRRVFTSDRRPARAGAWLQPRYSVRAEDTAEGLRDIVFGQGLLGRARSHAAGLVKRWR